MVLTRERGLVFGALSALLLAVVLAVAGALGSSPAPTSGVAAGSATLVSRSVDVNHVTVAVTSKPGDRVCFSAPHVSSCGTLHFAGQMTYATGRAGARSVIAGVAGIKVRSIIVQLSNGGAVWPPLKQGAFYAVLPRGFTLRAVVKVLITGRRVSFPA